jgi:hypothetical protein
MRIAILLAVLAIATLCGCIGQEHYQSVPADLKIVAYSDCSLSFRDWDSRVTIDSGGNGVLESRNGAGIPYVSDTDRRTFRLSEGELSSLLNSIDMSGFYELKGERGQVCITDTCSVIEVTKNGTTKKFTNDGCGIRQFTDAESAIWGIARNKTG